MEDQLKGFEPFYQQQLSAKLNDLEVKRVKAISRFRLFLLLGFLSFILMIIITICFFVPFLVFLTLFVSMICWGFAYGSIKNLRQELRPEFKKVVLFPILRFLYEDIDYKPLQRVAASVLNKSLLLNGKAQMTKGDDFVRCRIGQTWIQFSEIEAYSSLKGGMFYAGIFIAASFNKSFKTKTVVLSGLLASRFRLYSLKMNNYMINPSIINLEDPLFNKEFVVIGEDQVESRYLLSTNLMHRMLDYAKRINKKISFSFIENHLYISIPIYRDMFEPRIYGPINDPVFIKEQYNCFKLLTDVVEDLDLNTRIWL